MKKPLFEPIDVKSEGAEIHFLGVAVNGGAVGDIKLAADGGDIVNFGLLPYLDVAQYGDYGITNLSLDVGIAADDDHGIAYVAADFGRATDDHDGIG